MASYYTTDGQRQNGPFAAGQLAGIDPETQVWAEGWPAWRPAREVPELARAVAKPPRRPDHATPVRPVPHSPPQPQPAGYFHQMPVFVGQGSNGLGMASLVFGTIGLVTFCNPVGWIAGGIGLLLGLAGWAEAAGSRGRVAKGSALAGILVSLLPTILGVVGFRACSDVATNMRNRPAAPTYRPPAKNRVPAPDATPAARETATLPADVPESPPPPPAQVASPPPPEPLVQIPTPAKGELILTGGVAPKFYLSLENLRNGVNGTAVQGSTLARVYARSRDACEVEITNGPFAGQRGFMSADDVSE